MAESEVKLLVEVKAKRLVHKQPKDKRRKKKTRHRDGYTWRGLSLTLSHIPCTQLGLEEGDVILVTQPKPGMLIMSVIERYGRPVRPGDPPPPIREQDWLGLPGESAISPGPTD